MTHRGDDAMPRHLMLLSTSPFPQLRSNRPTKTDDRRETGIQKGMKTDEIRGKEREWGPDRVSAPSLNYSIIPVFANENDAFIDVQGTEIAGKWITDATSSGNGMGNEKRTRTGNREWGNRRGISRKCDCCRFPACSN